MAFGMMFRMRFNNSRDGVRVLVRTIHLVILKKSRRLIELQGSLPVDNLGCSLLSDFQRRADKRKSMNRVCVDIHIQQMYYYLGCV